LDGGSARHKASTYAGQNNTEKRGHTSMHRAGFEPVIPMFEQLKTELASDRAAIGTAYVKNAVVVVVVVVIIIIIIIIIN
jgi:hypothetical protein